MINDIIHQDSYKDLVSDQIEEVINYLLQNNKEFAITANLDALKFTPELPASIKSQLAKFSLYVLANYTFSTIKLENGFLSFEAGFGNENFGSTVTVPLYSIFQIIIDDSILYLNPIATVDKFNKDPKAKSLNIFKNNPKNQDLIK
ncbi:hypothetical protein CRU98_09105 [Arcobacter sp. CECT 8986]|uniref:hypothetical protein n=1 Tax=Arcobacter sp. CECT 8986 TaxID=2044507 RepID=UPI001009E810|nr:hypothetical protein [Arcobacter sp. CECT 8986]RXJ98520.1 hypothetical protein CRU98_09105 [Arcobacter sp. CECT 8986]